MLKTRSKKNRIQITLLLLFSFILGILPSSFQNIKAEENSRVRDNSVISLSILEKSEEFIDWTIKLNKNGREFETNKINLLLSETLVIQSTLNKSENLSNIQKDQDGNYFITLEESEEQYSISFRTNVLKDLGPNFVVEANIMTGGEIFFAKEDGILLDTSLTQDPEVAVEPLTEPIIEDPIKEEPAIEDPVSEDPIKEEPVVEEPIIEEPGEVDPVVEELLDETLTDEELLANQLGTLTGPDNLLVGPEISNIPTYGYYGVGESEEAPLESKKNSLRLGLGMETMSIVNPTTPGQVTVDKYAKPVPGLVNTWDITLRIEGMDAAKSSDIVLLIDRSGSMSQGTKMQSAKDAAKAFVQYMKNKPNTRIAVVSFASAFGNASTVNIDQSFLATNITANITALELAITNLDAEGGTNTQAGIRQAAILLNAPNSTADYKNIVLLSDGEPTQSYKINNVDTKLINHNKTESLELAGSSSTENRLIGKVTNFALVAADFDYNTTVGGGYATYKQIASGSNDSYSHGNSAIAQGNMFKNTTETGKQRTLWTIALETSTYGGQVLNSIASPGKAKTALPADLNNIFLEIAGSINSAARDSKVIDPMGAGFQIPLNQVANITKTKGTVTYDPATKILIWDIGDLTTPISTGSNIKFAELKYRVEINDSILILPVPVDGLYETNGNTVLNYKDPIGAILNKPFPQPKVNPIFLKMTKILNDIDGNPITNSTETFDITIKSNLLSPVVPNYPKYNETYTLIPNQQLVKTNLRLADTYTITENSPDHNTVITVNGVVQSTFTVIGPSLTNDSGQQDIVVEITNTEKAQGTLILKKILVDKDNNPIVGDTRPFVFNIVGPSGYTATRTLTGGQTVTIPALKYGVYIVTEVNPGNNFTVTSDPIDGKVTLKWDNKTGTVTITNKYISPKIDVVGNKIWENGNVSDHVAVILTLYRSIGNGPKTEVTGVPPVINPASGTSSQFTYTWIGLDQTDSHGVDYIYTVDELQTPLNYTKIQDGLTVTNRYNQTEVVIKKMVDGNFGDKFKQFSFTATLEGMVFTTTMGTGYIITPGNPNEATFTLAHNQSITFTLPVGAKLTIKESDNAGYIVFIDGVRKDDGEKIITVPAEGQTVIFRNNREVTVDTGVSMDSVPYLIILTLIGIGGVASLTLKRKRTNFS